MPIFILISDTIKKTSTRREIEWDVPRQDILSAHIGDLEKIIGISDISKCELCYFSDGEAQEVIDLTKSLERLGLAGGSHTFLLRNRISQVENMFGPASLSAEDAAVMARLKRTYIPHLKPDHPCPLCEQSRTGARRSKGAASSAAPEAPGPMPNPSEKKPTCEQGVQCGEASRIGHRSIPVSFGTASRLSISDGSRNVLGSNLGGGGFATTTDEIQNDLTALSRLREERRELDAKLREVQQELSALRQWKADHRCETSKAVESLKEQNRLLQDNLREVMRGRQQVMGLLQERRTAGSLLHGAPHPYTPFSTALPQQAFIDPKVLLAKGADGSLSELREHSALAATNPSQREDFSIVSERPQAATIDTSGVACQPGHCQLLIAGASGDPFVVQRRIGSHIIHGKNVLTLLSLDNVVTDEIYIDELEFVAAPGKCGLHIGTRSFEWQISLGPQERTNWLHWLYALNPWLTANRDFGGLAASH